MLFENTAILDENMIFRENRYVGIEGSRITYIGDRPPEKDFGETADGRGRLLMSAFYNAHAHSPMTLMRGYGENMALQDWLEKRIFPFEARLTGKAVYWGTLLAAAESLRFGIVSSTDMYYFCEEMAEAVLESGMKNNLGRGMVNFTDQDPRDMEAWKEMESLYRNFHGAGDGRIRVDISLHAEYTSNEKTARRLAEYAGELGANMHVHVSETRSEHEGCKERHGGLTPVAYLAGTGLFDTPATAAHCVWIEGEDFEILREKGVTVACNPVSNLKLASGVCNVPRLLKEGIRVALGTDSVASNNSLNFFEEMKLFALASKEKYQDPTAVTPEEALYAATRAGALSQGREDCGLIRQGARADLILIDIGQPNMRPVHRMTGNLVYAASGSDVVLTMADGRVLYRNGEYLTLDLEKILFESERAVQAVLRQI